MYYAWSSAGVPTETERGKIVAAWAAISSVADVEFVLRTNEPNYITVMYSTTPGVSFSSNIGMTGSQQFLRIWPAHFDDPGLLVHETCHALGMWHEQQRADRVNYVDVDLGQVVPSYSNNFSIINANLAGPYDMASTMHYPVNSFSAGGYNIVVKPAFRRFWHWRLGSGAANPGLPLSIGDRWTLAAMYGPAQALPPQVFALTTPVQGAAVGTAWPPEFTWAAAPGAETYRLEVDDDPLFRSPEIDATTAQTRHAAPGPLAPGRLFFWRVRAQNAAGVTESYPLPWQSFYTAPTYPGTLFVDDSAPPGGDGLSWATALNDLAVATEIAYASGAAVAEVRVGQGLYRPDSGSGDRSRSFVLAPGCALRGGYAGYGAPDPDARDLTLYTTTLSGDLRGDDGPNFTNSSDNSRHVVLGLLVDGRTSLDGVTVRAGNVSGPFGSANGAGAWVELGSPRITDCRFEANSASFGGGLFLGQSAATVERCVFAGNRAGTGPGGGGAFVFMTGSTRFINCLMAGNSAVLGGGIGAGQTQLALINCTFAGNSASTGGGAVSLNGFTTQQPRLTLVNCVLWGDTAPTGPELRVNTTNMGWVSPTPSQASVARTDIAGGQGLVSVLGGSTLLWGPGNIAADPRFVAPGTGDFRIGPLAPCIDAGDNTAVPPGVATDLAGGPRFIDDPARPDTGVGPAPVVDMGAYESSACYADCDTSTGQGVLDIFDFLCFQNRFDLGDPYACDCDTSSGPGACDIFDFLCFQNSYDAGCP